MDCGMNENENHRFLVVFIFLKKTPKFREIFWYLVCLSSRKYRKGVLTMKKATRILSVVLAIVLLVTSLPAVIAQTEPLPDPLYENSFLVTLQTQIAHSAEELQGLLDVDVCFIWEKETNEQGTTYQLEVMDYEATVEEAMERLEAFQGVTKVERNYYADDYKEKASSLTLSAPSLTIPMGSTATVKIIKADVKQGSYGEVGVAVEVDPQVLTYEQFCNLVSTLGEDIGHVALYEGEGADATQYPRVLYEYIKDGGFWRPEESSRYNKVSPVQGYIVTASGHANKWMLGELAQTDGILSAVMVYELLPTGTPPHEEWTVEDNRVAVIATDAKDEFDQFYTVTVYGNQVGQTTLTVKHGGDSNSITATCPVTVVEANPIVPKRYGDVNEDDAINAKDALEVLKDAVCKHHHSFLPIPPTLTQLLNYQQQMAAYRKFSAAANVNGDTFIDAKDALEILKYAVKKIDRFPVEDMVTPTDI